MSHTAIASVLALEDASVGERLVALALASFANSEHRAWPGKPAAALRAGLSLSQYLKARAALERRGALEVESTGGGRGIASVIKLRLAAVGPWIDGDVNADRLEAVLCHSRSRGAARLLLAVLAAPADDDGLVEGRCTDELRHAAGLSDAGYRRARAKLMSSGELELVEPGGGRGRANRWRVTDPRTLHAPLSTPAPRPTPPPSPPLLAVVTPEQPLEDTTGSAGSVDSRRVITAARRPAGATRRHRSSVTWAFAEGCTRKGPTVSGVTRVNSPTVSGVTSRKGPASGGVTEVKGPGLGGVSGNTRQSRTVSAETPSQTPSANARAGRESQNPLDTPPTPLTGGSSDLIHVQETSQTPSGRRRQRVISIEATEAERLLRPLSARDLADWQVIQRDLQQRLGRAAEIWLGYLSPAATSPSGELLLACSTGSRDWVSSRYQAVIAQAGLDAGRPVRAMTAREQQLHDALAARGQRRPVTSVDRQEAV